MAAGFQSLLPGGFVLFRQDVVVQRNRCRRLNTYLDYGTFEFLVRSGRALLYPVYKGALELRIKVAVLAAGGLRYDSPPETQPVNFMLRVKIPVLVINGRDDFSAPLDAQLRLVQLLGHVGRALVR